MTQRLIGVLLVLGLFAACGGDDDGGPASAAERCPDGTPENTTVACTCPDTGLLGTGLCMGSVIPFCNCAPAMTGTGGATPPVITGSTGGTTTAPGTGGTMMGSGGTGGMPMSMDDGGVDPMDSDGGMGAGSQGTACTTSDECSNGLACYNADHCSKSCTTDANCTSLKGATYTCYTTGMVCRVDCSANGNTDCPDGFSCQTIQGNVRRCQLE